MNLAIYDTLKPTSSRVEKKISFKGKLRTE
jgi:hypothetical protein